MPQSQRLSSAIPFVAIERPACPKCKAAMMLASIEPARAGVDLHTFECAICNRVLKTLAAYEDPMKSKGLGRWLQGDLHLLRKAAARTVGAICAAMGEILGTFTPDECANYFKNSGYAKPNIITL